MLSHVISQVLWLPAELVSFSAFRTGIHIMRRLIRGLEDAVRREGFDKQRCTSLSAYQQHNLLHQLCAYDSQHKVNVMSVFSARNVKQASVNYGNHRTKTLASRHRPYQKHNHPGDSIAGQTKSTSTLLYGAPNSYRSTSSVTLE